MLSGIHVKYVRRYVSRIFTNNNVKYYHDVVSWNAKRNTHNDFFFCLFQVIIIREEIIPFGNVDK